MEKPKKMNITNVHGWELDHNRGYNNALSAMSAWIEGAVPTVGELEIILKRYGGVNSTTTFTSTIAEHIHTLLTQRLGGKC